MLELMDIFNSLKSNLYCKYIAVFGNIYFMYHVALHCLASKIICVFSFYPIFQSLLLYKNLHKKITKNLIPKTFCYLTFRCSCYSVIFRYHEFHKFYEFSENLVNFVNIARSFHKHDKELINIFCRYDFLMLCCRFVGECSGDGKMFM